MAKRGKDADAEASFREAIKVDPKYAIFHCNLGRLLEKLGKDADAEASYRDAIRVDPKLAVTHLNLAGILEKRGDVDGAIHEVSEFIRKRGHPGIDGEAILAMLVERKEGPK